MKLPGGFTLSGGSNQWVRQLVLEDPGQLLQVFEGFSCTSSWRTDTPLLVDGSDSTPLTQTNDGSTWPLVRHVVGRAQLKLSDRVNGLRHLQSHCGTKMKEKH